jgi:hypothetical protein
MPSTDGRKEYDTAYLDIWQHRIRNQDWSGDWVFTDSRFDLLYGPDDPFLKFLAETVHPIVRPDSEKASEIVDEYNSHLAIDGWELYVVREISKRPVFGYRRIADGAQRQIKIDTVTETQGLQPHHPKAFVSHSTQDHAFAEKFATHLRAHGVDAWFSKWEIKPGDSIRAKIEEGLEGCEYFVIVLSKSSIQRPWVQRELDAATMRNLGGQVRKIIPVKIEDCGDLPPTLASLCWEDFSNQPYDAALKRVLDSICELATSPPLGKLPVVPTQVDKVRPAFIAILKQMAPDEAALLKVIADLTDGYESFLRSFKAPSRQALDRAIAAQKVTEMKRLRASFRQEGEDESAMEARLQTCVHLLGNAGLIEIGDDIIIISALGKTFLEACYPPQSEV